LAPLLLLLLLLGFTDATLWSGLTLRVHTFHTKYNDERTPLVVPPCVVCLRWSEEQLVG
jgi:hypothetical protein